MGLLPQSGYGLLGGIAPGLVFLALFPLIWLGVSVLIAAVGGWRRLAESYPAPAEEPPARPGDRFRGASLSFGGGPVSLGNYRNVVTITLGDRGLGLRTALLFRFGHPAILVPWSAVRQCREGRTFGLQWALLDFANGQRMRVYGRPVGALLSRAAQGGAGLR